MIDWGGVHLGDPATDLAAVCAVLPPAAREGFLVADGPVDEDTWAPARFRAADHSVLVALYAHDAGDEALLAEALGGLGRVAAAAGAPRGRGEPPISGPRGGSGPRSPGAPARARP